MWEIVEGEDNALGRCFFACHDQIIRAAFHHKEDAELFVWAKRMQADRLRDHTPWRWYGAEYVSDLPEPEASRETGRMVMEEKAVPLTAELRFNSDGSVFIYNHDFINEWCHRHGKTFSVKLENAVQGDDLPEPDAVLQSE